MVVPSPPADGSSWAAGSAAGRVTGKDWYAALDRDLTTALEALSEEDVTSRRIARGDFEEEYFSPQPIQELDVYREALLIFYGKASVYLRAMDRALPPQWQHWIG
jgi:hypothetical protein